MNYPNEEEQAKPGEAVADALGCVAIPLLVVLLMYGLPFIVSMGFIEEAKKMHEEKQAERYAIEGEVASIEVREEEPEPEPEFMEKEGEKKPRIVIKYGGPSKPKTITRIEFVDGRFKEFRGVTEKPMEPGKYYKITFDGLDVIVEFEEVPDGGAGSHYDVSDGGNCGGPQSDN